jgi:hypothetical protein
MTDSHRLGSTDAHAAPNDRPEKSAVGDTSFVPQTLARESSIHNPSRAELRAIRLDALLQSCRDQVLQQVIGPFGLTPAMFDDKVGGNVTTQHNAEKDIFAKEEEEYCRPDYDYAEAKRQKLKEAHASGQMNSQEFTDVYTGEKASTKRTNASGKLVMNAELDHTISMKQAHREGGWMKDKGGRKEISSQPENLHYTTTANNRSKSSKAPEDALTGERGFDENRIRPIVEKAREAVDAHLPAGQERAMYHGKELISTGGREALNAGFTRAMGVLMYEFVNGSYLEICLLVKEPESGTSLVDRTVDALQRVAQRLKSKLASAFDALVTGGAQGFLSNLLTFIINSVITTSAKVVTIIREGMKGLWEAIKLVVAPPPGTSGMEVARAATQLIAGVVTLGVGMLFEESVKGFFLTLPLLAPLADTLAPAVTGILTGLMTAFTIYGIDRLFDWLSSKGTEHLEAQLGALDADAVLVERVAAAVSQQYEQSRLLDQILHNNEAVLAQQRASLLLLADSTEAAQRTIETRTDLAASIAVRGAAMLAADDELQNLLNQYNLG